MAFFSGIKAAYDSIGSELSRTFDSSSQSEEMSSGPANMEAITVPSPIDESSIYNTPRGDFYTAKLNPERVKNSSSFSDNWGKWEEQKMLNTRHSSSKQPFSENLSPLNSSLVENPEGTVPSSLKSMSTPAVTTNSDGGGSVTTISGGGGSDTVTDNVPFTTSTPAKSRATSGKSQMDNLSREDLMKYIKKQGLLLQKTKLRCENLTKECEELKKVNSSIPVTTGGEGMLAEELQVVRSERDAAVNEGRSLHSSVAGLEREKQDLTDKLQALEEAHSKLKQFFQEQQLEKEKDTPLQREKTESKEMPEIEEESSKLKSEVLSLQKQLEEKDMEFTGRLGEMEREKQTINSKYAELLKKAKKLQSEVKTQREKLTAQDSLSNEITKLREEREGLVSEIANLQKVLESTEHHPGSNTENLKEFDEVNSKCSQLERRLASSMESQRVQKEEMEELRSSCTQLEQEVLISKRNEEALSEELKEVRSKCTQLEQDYLASKRSEEALNEELKEVRSKCTQLEQHIETGKKNEEALNEELKEVRSKCTELDQHIKTGEKDEEAKLKEVRSKYTELEQDYLAAKRSEEALNEELKELGSKCTELEQCVKTEKRNEEALNEELKVLGSKCTELEQCVKTGKRNEEVLNEELKVIGSKCTELEQCIETGKRNEEVLNEELIELKSKLEGNITNRVEETLEGELSEARVKSSQLEVLLTEEQNRTKSLLETNKELEKSHSKSQSSVEELQEKCKKFLCQLEDTQKENAELKSQLIESQGTQHGSTDTSSAEQERTLFQEKLVGMEHRLKELETDLEKTTDELDDARKRNLELEQNMKFDDLREKLNQCQIALEESTKEKENLKKESDKNEEALRKEMEVLRTSTEKDSIAHKEESKKLKAFVIKIKKELSETRARETALRQQLEIGKTASEGMEELESKLLSLTKAKEELEESHRNEIASLQSKQEESSSLIGRLSEEGKKLRVKVVELEDSVEVSRSELASVQSDLATVQSEKNTLQMAEEKAQSELRIMKEELDRDKETNRTLTQKLNLMEKEAKSSTLMSMELEDYHRSIQSLEGELAEKEQLLEQAKRECQVHQETLQQLRKDMELQTQQYTLSEETIAKLKQLLLKNKKELAEGKRQEEELHSTVAGLQAQLEEERQGSELAKVEVSQVTAKIYSMKQQSELTVENLQRSNCNLEHRLSLVQGELTATRTALAAVKSDYESYKVRVHSVLKQKSTGPGEAEINNEMKIKYESELVKLTTELQEVKSKLASSLTDYEDLLLKHEQLASRHEQLLRDSDERREGLERAMREEATRHSLQSQEQTELIIQLRYEIKEVTKAFKVQLHGLQEEHNKVTVGLKEELEAAQNNINRLQQEADSKILAKSSSVVMPTSEGTHPQNLEVKRPPFEQRSSGEGMEQAELDSVTSSIPPTPLSLDDSSLSFERLLSMGGGENTSNSGHEQNLNSNEIKLYKQLKRAFRKTEHLTELLRESEANSLRLGDQAKLLKEEIRRLERNQEREREVSNMEYLKNVVLKFLHNEGAERSRLIPIIETLLKLSPQEVKYLEDTIIKGEQSELPGANPDKGPGSKPSGWSGYVHRWTGY